MKKLQKYGNSYAVVLDKVLLEAAGFTPDTPLTVKVIDGGVTITSANVGVGRERVAKLMDEVERDFGKALTRLSK